MKINKNKGMYIETIIGNSIHYYEHHNNALFRKQSIPIKIKEINENIVTGYLKQKCDVDYYGIYLGRYVAIEAKQTIKNYFNISTIQKHQQEYLSKIIDYQGISLLIIYFQINDSFYCINWLDIKSLINKNIKKIDLKWLEGKNYKLELYFPGRLDFLNILNKKI